MPVTCTFVCVIVSSTLGITSCYVDCLLFTDTSETQMLLHRKMVNLNCVCRQWNSKYTCKMVLSLSCTFFLFGPWTIFTKKNKRCLILMCFVFWNLTALNDALKQEIQHLKVLTGQTIPNGGGASTTNLGNQQYYSNSNHSVHALLTAQQLQQLQIHSQKQQQQQQNQYQPHQLHQFQRQHFQQQHQESSDL